MEAIILKPTQFADKHFFLYFCLEFEWNAPSFCSTCELTMDLKGKRLVAYIKKKGKKEMIGIDKEVEFDILSYWSLLIFLLLIVFSKK